MKFKFSIFSAHIEHRHRQSVYQNRHEFSAEKGEGAEKESAWRSSRARELEAFSLEILTTSLFSGYGLSQGNAAVGFSKVLDKTCFHPKLFGRAKRGNISCKASNATVPPWLRVGFIRVIFQL